jgi:transcription-repair coupling factor (superfamily II helicase)
MRARLREAVPELSVAVAHGRLDAADLDQAMLDFARGARDVLLATNIIEAGLDLPNANTMLIWRADRFGLGQLHQLRGRVGRGRVRAALYLLTDPARPPSAAARKRLETVAALDSLGAGFAISLADLDQRGAGDLLGEEQAGHLRLIGTELYRHVLGRARARARGEAVADRPEPEIALDLPAFLPTDYVPDANTRLELYRRLAKAETSEQADEMAEELADRFGDPPVEAAGLVDLTRVRLLCLAQGIVAVHAGPRGVALTPAQGERHLLPIQEASPRRRLSALLAALSEERHGRIQAA